MATTIKAKDIIGKVREIIQDRQGKRRTDRELLAWLCLGQRQIVLLKPNANTTRGDILLVAGSRQSGNASAVLELTRNTNGAAIRKTTRDILDALDPSWHTAPSSATVLWYCPDEHNPNVFWVYPPQPTATTATVEAVQSVPPADIPFSTISTALISLDDIYEVPLIEYICFRVFSEDTDDANEQRANTHAQAFLSALNVKAQEDAVLTLNPRQQNQPTKQG